MTEYVLPVVIAAFLWWFSTGLVLLLDGLPRTTYRWSLMASSGLALIGLAAIAATARDSSGRMIRRLRLYGITDGPSGDGNAHGFCCLQPAASTF